VLTEFDYGIYNIFYSLIAFWGLIGSLGLDNTLIRFLPEYIVKNEMTFANKVFRAAIVLRIISLMVFILLFLIFWKNISPLLKIENYEGYFYIFIWLVLIIYHNNFICIFLESCFLQKFSQSSSVILVFIKICAYSIIFFYGLGLGYVFSFEVFATFLTGVYLYIVKKKYVRVKPNEVTKLDQRQEWKRLLRYALYFNFNDAGSGILGPQFDNFILVLYLSPVVVGAYSLFNRIMQIIQRVSPMNSFQNILRPIFFSVEENENKIKLYFRITYKLNLLIILPIAITMILFPDQILILFFSGKFLSYSFALPILVIFVILNSFQFPVGLVAQYYEKVNVILLSKIFSIYNIFADIILIKYWGILGAVVATGTATLLKNLFIMYFIKENISLNGLLSFHIKTFGIWILIVIPFVLFKQLLSEDAAFFCFLFISIPSILLLINLNSWTDGESDIILKLLNAFKLSKISPYIKMFNTR
jgi:O-antigen/teichoic acid export membrane protein